MAWQADNMDGIGSDDSNAATVQVNSNGNSNGNDNCNGYANVSRSSSSSSAGTGQMPMQMPMPLDVEAYAALYSGRTKIRRLLFIAEHCGNAQTQAEALRMAYEEAKKGVDVSLFKDAANAALARLGPDYGPDHDWIESVQRRAEVRRVSLENELNSYKTNLIKESIRMGYNDLGDFYYAHGMLGDAFKNYVRTRDYCTTSKHIIQMCLNVILVSIEMDQFMHVPNYVVKAEQTPDIQDQSVVVAKLKCAAGLVYLENKKYKLAARKFVETNFDIGNNFAEVIASQDIATYGGLCALASFDRAELKNKVIDNANFRNFLELVPEVRELIHDFYASRYASCLKYLQNLRSNLMLDIHLHEHVENLYDQIRHKALIQYTTPFISVNLHTMANAFMTDVAGLQKELEALIMDNQIQARIDSHKSILYARHANQRNTTFQRVLQTGDEFDREARSMLLRAGLIKHDNTSRLSKRI